MAGHNQKYHFRVATAKVTFLRDGNARVTELNTVMMTTKKNVTAEALDNARKAVLQRVCEQFEVSPDVIRDYVILGLSYLGHMTEAEFQGEEAAPAVRPNPTMN